ncbi:hypothetical protein [Pedobacter glucosidilyticus]|uniref:hypothetical protein n=1 Tax=Pedobacter glucosidilyticus TaxID=1122941 RepID=UPI0026ED5926|nr:hypothetical protein [Pedobacter glucosidilyticus]
MNNTLYFIGGITSLILGLYITINQIRIFLKKEQDELGWDIKLLGGGVTFVILGIMLIMDSF